MTTPLTEMTSCDSKTLEVACSAFITLSLSISLSSLELGGGNPYGIITKMNPPLLLHTAARSYCMENYTKWSRIYAKLNQEGLNRNGQKYTDEALSIFPRYNTLAAILVGIERIDTDNPPDFTALKDALIEAGRAAGSPFVDGKQGVIESRSIAEEREQFCSFVSGFNATSEPSIAPLPYRRVLSPQETKLLWDRISPRWKANGGYWFPLAERSDPSLFAFHTEDFDQHARPELLREIMLQRGVRRVYELREYGDENYLLAVEGWEPYYSGAEGFWVSDALDWILYASHEGSMTTGGWLTEEVFRLWPDGRNLPWTFMK